VVVMLIYVKNCFQINLIARIEGKYSPKLAQEKSTTFFTGSGSLAKF